MMKNKNISPLQGQNAGEIDDDDRPIGRILNRREVLALLGTTGATLFLGGCAVPSLGGGAPGGESSVDLSAVATTNAALPTGCVVRPELTEGPVFVEEELNRSDIRSDPSNGTVSEGARLDLTFRVNRLVNRACSPLAGVQVDVWQCDARGIYSDTSELGMQTVGQKFLRGYQVTDENGLAHFTTIYPGWYEGRTVHIHFKIRTADGYDFTSQLFFDDALTDEVLAQAPYNSRGERRLRNDNDGIYGQSGGQTVLAVTPVAAGYTTTFEVALDII